MAAEESTSNFQVINEEFKIWKKNCPFLYDVVVTHALEWPSLTCEWLPEPMVDEENHRVVHNLVLGTHCGEGAQNALLLANVTLPLASAGWDDVKVDANSKIECCASVLLKKYFHFFFRPSRAGATNHTLCICFGKTPSLNSPLQPTVLSPLHHASCLSLPSTLALWLCSRRK